jgi:glutathione synthase/RimK-type ligase-like ATP-grasp enzyme
MKERPHPSEVLIVGSREDEHVAAVARRLEELGVESLVVDTLAFPARTRISLTEELDGITVDGRLVGRPGAVYLRQLHAHPLACDVEAADDLEEDWRTTLIAFREKATLLTGLLARWETLGVPIFNPPSTEWRNAKPVQLGLLRAAGLPVPESLWTNDAEAVRRFGSGRRVAYKPVAGGAATRELSEADLTPERLEALETAPVTFQELLPGEDVRVYVLDGEIIAALRITSSALDFRQNEESIESTPLPPEVARQCLKAAEVCGLRWTGMDLKRSADGTLKFLELNTSAMFLGFDARAGTNILDRLAEALASTVRTLG